MSLIAKENSGEGFEPIPTGVHHGLCYGIVDIGTQPGNEVLKYAPSHKVVFLYEIPEERIEIEQEGRKVNLPRTVSSMYTLSLGKKAKLRPMLESWRGRPFTEAELEGFDLKNVLGANGLLNIIHTKKADKTYANISSVSPLMKGTPKRTTELPQIFFSLAECGDRIVVPNTLPDWIKAKIMQSAEYVAEQTRQGHPEPTDDQLSNVNSDIDPSEVPF